MKLKIWHIVGVGAIMAILQTLLTIFNWYQKYVWIDIPMHMLGGFVVGLMWLWVLQSWNRKLGKVEMLSVLGFVLLGGLAWELFEIFCWKFLTPYLDFAKYYVPDVVDLTSDLVNDTIGGIIAMVLYKLKK